MVLIFLYAEKAFDYVSWTFIKTQLEYMDFGHQTLQAAEQIYSAHFTKIIINNNLTSSVQILKDIRKGCPLLLLLFILFLEMLFLQIHTDADIQDLKMRKLHIKLQDFADDLVIILENLL